MQQEGEGKVGVNERRMWSDLSIFAISDLHLSFNKSVPLFGIDPEKDVEKSMDIFGWGQHYHQIRDGWLDQVSEMDTVLIPGDISWAMSLDVAQYDFGWIDQLPGKKVLSPGNHCYYVQSKRKVRAVLPAGMEWIDADYTMVEGLIVAGVRGWNLPGDRFYHEEEDRKIYQRQVGRLRIALEAADRQYPELEKWVMIHFPPLTKYASESAFMEVMKKHGVTTCIYGHLHGKMVDHAMQGMVEGMMLKLVACDALSFCPVKLR
jgi:uncharacterized protein